MLFVSRVLHEDDDFVTIEVGKHDGVEFNLQRDENGEVVGGDRFLTVVFVRADEDNPGRAVQWNPFEDAP